VCWATLDELDSFAVARDTCAVIKEALQHDA